MAHKATVAQSAFHAFGHLQLPGLAVLTKGCDFFKSWKPQASDSATAATSRTNLLAAEELVMSCRIVAA